MFRKLLIYITAALLAFSAVSVSANGLLGGGASQYASIWAQPKSESFVRFLFRLATDIRFDKNIVMTFNRVSLGEDYLQRLIDAHEKDELPDVAIVSAPMILQLKAAGVPLSVIPTDLLSVEIDETLLDSLTIADELMGLPFYQGEHLLLFYNTQIVESPIKTLGDLKKQRDYLSQSGISSLIWPYFDSAALCSLFGCATDAQFEDASRQSRLMRSVDLFSNNCASEASTASIFYSCMVNQFYQGNVAYMATYASELGEALTHYPATLGVAKIPSFGDGQPQQTQQPVALVFFGDAFSSGRQHKSKRIANYLLGSKIQKRIFERLKRIPVNKSVNQVYVQTYAGEHDLLNIDQLGTSRLLSLESDEVKENLKRDAILHENEID